MHFARTYSKTFGFIIGDEGEQINDLGSSIRPDITIINLEYGQSYFLGDSSFRLFGGGQYVNFSANESSYVQLVDNSEENRKTVN